ncbi:dTDP-4-keto-L-rhamnose reductase and dTDP-4-keto-6-deoxyglucose-3,5-epimerase [metagenome]|uniref:dTDP-4-keto-L-rhamnose reductase and dTDP-4-keto-6-deoxyglucose-3,5-epimerase n=1 Tax=metagenome TaxID=256318 RepID=A0A2P2C0A1_9ZZZZ
MPRRADDGAPVMDLSVETTTIPGLLVLRTPVHADARGWFKEAWQRAKMVEAGLPDFGPVQANVSYNDRRGATRGIHAEPWDKLVSVATGRVFAAWVDLREGDSFGATVHLELDASVAVFVPRGVGNSYQTLEDATAYSYLVNQHWQPGTAYLALSLADPSAAIPWPVPLAEASISEKDQANPFLTEVTPMPARRTLIVGREGQLARALSAAHPEATVAGRSELDVTDPGAVAAWPWADYDVVLNASAYTAVDEAETAHGRPAAWALNATAVGHLAAAAREHGLTLVHFSTDYVFDGAVALHTETEPVSPLGVYGQSKAAGELAATGAPRHYVLRTSWLIGDGPNFVRTMVDLAGRGVAPAVVDDQVGRLTFTDELVRATNHLLDTRAAYGVYHVTNGGEPQSWHVIAQTVFKLAGGDAWSVTPVSTEEYAAGRPLAPRPRHSTLSLDKLEATGFVPVDGLDALTRYVRRS